MMRRAAVLVWLVAMVPSARADDALPPILRRAAITQRLDEQVPLDTVFRDEEGRSVRLGDYFGDKPVVLVLAYFRCPMLCTQVLNGLVDGLRVVPWDVGGQFLVLTVSFDPREGPELAAAKKASYLDSYGRPGAAAGWHFLTGERAAIDRLAGAVGFGYVYDAEKDQFAHASGVMVLTPGGKVARYLLGIQFSPRDLRLALAEASEGKIGSPVDRVLLFCLHYDPATGKYTASVMNFVRLAGGVVFGLLALLLGRAWYRERRRRAAAPTV
jgi:protein SCO1/2